MRPEENERLVRVGPGTPMGEAMRCYWQPALLASEVPENDGPPVRVRLLGENLLAFRDSTGRVGLVDAFCPHRRAPLFFGRNEECGIRCAYHGWKFDADGTCVDMPSEPAGTPLQKEVRIKAYPTVERGGLIWTYMGPRAQQPEPPDYEWMRAPETHRWVSKTFEDCNYLQAMEGGFDTAHSSFAHNNNIKAKNEPRNADTAPRLDIERTDYGYCYWSTRNTGNGRHYIRVYHYVMPGQQLRGAIHNFDGTPKSHPELDGHIWVPIDDTTTHVYNWMAGFDHNSPIGRAFAEERETYFGRGPDDLIPGTFRLRKNAANDYMIDRRLQRTQTFTGIVGVNTQDFALQEGMGPIVDRSREFLGSSDRAIVTLRRMLMEAIEAVERGERPRGTDPAPARGVRAYDGFITAGGDWRRAFADGMRARW